MLETFFNWLKWIVKRGIVRELMMAAMDFVVAREIARHTNLTQVEVYRLKREDVIKKAMDVLWAKHPEYMALFEYRIQAMMEKEADKKAQG